MWRALELLIPVAIIVGLVAIGVLVIAHRGEIVNDEMLMAIITGLASVLGMYVRDRLRSRRG